MMNSLTFLLWALAVRLTRNTSGALSSEYSFLFAFIAIIAAVGMVTLGTSIGDYFDAVTRLVPDTSLDPVCPMGECP